VVKAPGVAAKNARIIRRYTSAGTGRQRVDVLFCARPNLFQRPGGDTEVVINLKRALTRLGVRVDFRPSPTTEVKYELVHIFNCDTPIAIESALLAKPYVITPLYEDTNRYYVRSLRAVSYFRDYLDAGDRSLLEERLASLQREEERPLAMEWKFALCHAATICATGTLEADTIRRQIPEVAPVEIVPMGFNRPAQAEGVSPDLFIEHYGVRDFVLCVGRLESRKNQLLLLYSLQEDDIPIVFVNSDTVQPEYEALCKRFPRKGKTVFTGRVKPEMLWSAYKAARVHALPSWYELPGLASLEAAWFGCSVVATDWGTLPDYLGDSVFYCSPYDPVSVREAVLKALEAPRNEIGRRLLEECRWENEAERLAHTYRRLLDERATQGFACRLQRAAKDARLELSYYQRRDGILELMRSDIVRALPLLDQLIAERPTDPLNYLFRGEARLKVGRVSEAEEDLRTSIEIKKVHKEATHLYLALALLQQRKWHEAREVLVEATEIYPFMNEGAKAIVADYLERCEDTSTSGTSAMHGQALQACPRQPESAISESKTPLVPLSKNPGAISAVPRLKRKGMFQFIEEEYDYPDSTQPKISYIVCSVPRSGSKLLCFGLRDTGLAGFPYEYFHHMMMPELMKRFRVDNMADYVRVLQQKRTGPNGVFGINAHYKNNFQSAIVEPGIKLEDLFPNIKYVYIHRRDLLAQAISYSRAMQTQSWATIEEEKSIPEFNYEHIKGCRDFLVQEERAWETYFEENRIDPYPLIYEDFAGNYQKGILDVLDYLGIPVPASIDLPEPILGIQRDEVSELWKETFLEIEGRAAKKTISVRWSL
jgi:LPS sulfotransferase NodH/glycosyltransferase involved in cell wall biosynthesis